MPEGEEGAVWTARVRADLRNYRVALQTAAADDPAALAPLVANLRMAWHMHGHFDELEAWIVQALPHADAAGLVRVELLDALGMMQHMRGDAGAAAVSFQAAAYALSGMAAISAREGAPGRAARLLGAAGARLRAAGIELERFEREMADEALAAARAALGAAEAQRLQEEGAAAVPDDAVCALARRVAPDSETLAG
jgi:hypothetical protein